MALLLSYVSSLVACFFANDGILITPYPKDHPAEIKLQTHQLVKRMILSRRGESEQGSFPLFNL
jgi:hypothetical protein